MSSFLEINMDITKYFTTENILPLVLDFFLKKEYSEAIEILKDENNQYGNFLLDYTFNALRKSGEITKSDIANASSQEVVDKIMEKIMMKICALVNERAEELLFLAGK